MLSNSIGDGENISRRNKLSVMKNERRQLHDWEKEECAALKREIASFNARAAKGKRLTQEVIAEELGMSQGTLSSHLNGQRPINKEMAAKMAALLDIPIERFSRRLAGQIEQLAKASKIGSFMPGIGAAAAAVGALLAERDQFVVVPRFDMAASMGPGIVVPEHLEIIQQLVIDREWIRDQRLLHTGAPNLAVITGFGDSMQGTFSDGDPLMIDRGVNAMDKDGIYVFSIEGVAHVKRLQRIGGSRVKVISDNPTYDRWEADLSEIVIHARVLIGLNVKKME